MASRLKLQNELEELLGSRFVYYQPPESIRLNYPCIVYTRKRIEKDNADDTWYLKYHNYELTLIDPNPDSELVDKLCNLSMCKHVNHFTSDSLNHDVFSLYY